MRAKDGVILLINLDSCRFPVRQNPYIKSALEMAIDLIIIAA